MLKPDLELHSPNYNPYLVQGRTVIIHATRSGKSNYAQEAIGTINWMMREGTVSSHWLITRDGRAIRLVPDYYQAWHGGSDNRFCWGIELEQGVESDGFTDIQIARLKDVMRHYHEEEGVPYNHAATSEFPGFIGHQETAQGQSYGKTDPGSLFPWETVLASSSPPHIRQIGFDDQYGEAHELWHLDDNAILTAAVIWIGWSDGRMERLYE